MLEVDQSYRLGPVDVVVQSRLIEDAQCTTPANCKFQYTDDATPTLNDPVTKEFNCGDTYTLTGSKLNMSTL